MEEIYYIGSDLAELREHVLSGGVAPGYSSLAMLAVLASSQNDKENYSCNSCPFLFKKPPLVPLLNS